MHSGDLSEMNQASLSEQEKEALLEVMERAKEFDKQLSSMELGMEGQLHKWTNPLKGWQPRWFSVDHQQGVLHYYTSEDKKKQAPRGSLHLWGAVVAPSEEDSQSFAVNGANGEVYKLRGQDAKERQFWVSRLRREVEHCTSGNQSLNRESVDSAVGDSISPRHTPSKGFKRMSTFNRTKQSTKVAVASSIGQLSAGSEKASEEASHTAVEDFPGGDIMLEVLTRLQSLQDSFYIQLQTNTTQAGLSPTDREVLLSRATSQAALTSVKDCLALLKLQAKESQLPSEENLQNSAATNHQSAEMHYNAEKGKNVATGEERQISNNL